MKLRINQWVYWCGYRAIYGIASRMLSHTPESAAAISRLMAEHVDTFDGEYVYPQRSRYRV